MRIAVYPGSFDPITNGHLDIIRRSSKLFDMVIVGVLINNQKTPTFDIDERIDLIKRCTSDIKNVEVSSFSGLLVDFLKLKNASVIIRGLRALADFEYEFQLALTNKMLDNEIETIFLTTDNKFSFVSSSIVRELALLGGDISELVPKPIKNIILERLSKK